MIVVSDGLVEVFCPNFPFEFKITFLFQYYVDEYLTALYHKIHKIKHILLLLREMI